MWLHERQQEGKGQNKTEEVHRVSLSTEMLLTFKISNKSPPPSLEGKNSQILNVKTNVSLIDFYLVHETSLLDRRSVTQRPLYDTFWFTAHHVFPGFLYNDSCLTVSPHTKPGICFNEPGPQGEKKQLLIQAPG